MSVAIAVYQTLVSCLRPLQVFAALTFLSYHVSGVPSATALARALSLASLLALCARALNRCPPTTTCRHRSASCGLLAFYSSLPRSSPFFIAAALTIDKPWVRGKRPHKPKCAAVPSSVGRAGGRSSVLGYARHCPRTPFVGVLGASVCVLRCFPLCVGVALPMMTRIPCARRFGRPPSVALPLRFAPVGAALCALKLCVCFLSCYRVVRRLQFFGSLLRLSTVK